jgi:primase-polymerase (primpol)-like protein
MVSTVTPGLQRFLDSFGDRRAFVVYALYPREDGGTDKIPIDPRSGVSIDAQNAANRITAAEARAWVERGIGAGIGLVITEDSGLAFLDLDHCRAPDGSWMPHALYFVGLFPGAYVEISQSGEGLHVIFPYQGPRPTHRTRNRDYRMELYTGSRFCALTGVGAQ